MSTLSEKIAEQVEAAKKKPKKKPKAKRDEAGRFVKSEDTADEDTRELYPSSYQLNENWGFQVNFMVPLDREGLKQCKRIAKRQEEKMRLDYELVRALKCAELMQRGFTYHPQSEMKVLCQDIVPISALQPPKKKKFWQK